MHTAAKAVRPDQAAAGKTTHLRPISLSFSRLRPRRKRAARPAVRKVATSWN